MDHKTWLKLTNTDPDAARAAHANGEVEFPDYISSSLSGTQPQRERTPTPTDLEGVQAQQRELNRRHNEAVANMKASSDELLPGRGQQREPVTLPEGAEAITHTAWLAMSKRSPDKAMAYHRAGLVDVPDHFVDAMGG